MKKVLIVILALLCIGASYAFYYYNNKNNEILKEQDKLQQQINDLQNKYSNTENEIEDKNEERIKLTDENKEKLELYESWKNLNEEVKSHL